MFGKVRCQLTSELFSKKEEGGGADRNVHMEFDQRNNPIDHSNRSSKMYLIHLLQLFIQCTMRKKTNIFFYLARQASDGKMYFLVLVTKFAYFLLKVPRHGLVLRLRVMTEKNNFWP